MIKAAPIRKAEVPAAVAMAKIPRAPQRRPNGQLIHAILQRKEDERARKPGGSHCESGAGKAKGWLQRKLTIGSAHDPLEREADRVADRVLAMSAPTGVQRSPIKIQRAASPPFQPAEQVPESVHRVIGGSGGPLDRGVRQDMEQRFGHDFSEVRVHRGTEAAQSAREVGAQAYTVGRDIVFGAGRFAPATQGGRRLLAHELAHVVQQGAARGPLRRAPVPGGPKLSAKADDLAKKLKALIAVATWPEIRKRVYPLESAAGVKRAEQRRAGKLPDMSGLGSLKSLDKFAAKIRSLQAKWKSFSTAQARVAEVDKITADILKDASVPKFENVYMKDMVFMGGFSPLSWSFAVKDKLVLGSVLGDKDAAELANVTLHESRHAEQHFLSARYAAGKLGQSAAVISQQQDIPAKIADQAVAQPLKEGITDLQIFELGKTMYTANVTEGAKNQNISDDDRIKEMGEDRIRAEKALADLLAGESAATLAAATKEYDALKAQIAEVERRYTLYRNIPYEFDAHEVGDAAGVAFTKAK